MYGTSRCPTNMDGVATMSCTSATSSADSSSIAGPCGNGNSQTVDTPPVVVGGSASLLRGGNGGAGSAAVPLANKFGSLHGGGGLCTAALEVPGAPGAFPALAVGNSITRHFTSLTTTAAFVDPPSRPSFHSLLPESQRKTEDSASDACHEGGGLCVEGRLVEGEYVNYWRVIPVRIKTGDREDFTASLTVKVFTCTAPSGRAVGPSGLFEATDNGGASGTCNQVLRVELTYEADPYFLFSLEVGENEFHVLKSEQRLLVNFQTFPAKFVELLEECVRQHHQEPSHPQRLIAIFISNGFCGGVGGRLCGGGEAFLNLVESNQFRELTHLSLKFRQGNDEAIKRHLAKQLLYFKGHCEEVKRRLSGSEESNRSLSDKMDKLNTAVQQTNSEHYCLRETLTAQHQQELAALNDSHAKAISSLRQLSSDQLTKADAQRVEQTSALDDRARCAERRAEQGETAKRALEQSQGEMTRQLHLVTKEAADRAQQVERLGEETKSLDAIKFQQEKLLAEMTVKLKGSQDQLADKVALLRNSTCLIEQTKARSGSAEEALGAEKTRCERAEDELNASIDEIRKGNEIIDKLQTQIRTLKSKLKQLQQTNSQMDKATSDLEVKMERCQHKFEQAEARRQLAGDKEMAAKDELADAKSKLEDMNRELQSSKDVTMRLNKELTNKQVDSYLCKFPYSAASTPSLPSKSPSEMLLSNYSFSPHSPSSSLEKLPPFPSSTFASLSSHTYPTSSSLTPAMSAPSLLYSFGGQNLEPLRSPGSPLTPSFPHKQTPVPNLPSASTPPSSDLLPIEYSVPPPTMRESTGWLKAQ
eukprot:GHVS01024382.1.p1 GENE.GHVS01024382.1~~GHVS01024382.1.p1  ORF type:complete len:887 (+),score=174.46 GHVS01024382.1:215-2662(+)